MSEIIKSNPKITSGKRKEPLTIMLYGVAGIGKTQLASESENPIFIGERGNLLLDVSRFDEEKTFAEFVEDIKWLIENEHIYKTLVIDTLSWLEPLVFQEVCSEQTKPAKDISKVPHGAGYTSAYAKMESVTKLLNDLKDKKKMNVVIIAHSKVKPFNDPTSIEPYDKYVPSLNEAISAIWVKYVDALIFMNYETFVKEGERRAYGDALRIAYTEERPSFQAKNRYGLPYRIAMRKGEGWKTLVEAIEKSEPNSLEVLQRAVAELRKTISGEPEFLSKVDKSISDAGVDLTKLTAIRDRMVALTGGLK